MSRNRVIYQSEALFAAPTGEATVTAASHGLRRVQSCNYNFSIQRQDINQYGELAAIDRLILQEPTVAVDMSYYFEPTGFNEEHLGLRVNRGDAANDAAATGDSLVTNHALDYIISGGATYDQKNVFILTSDAGVDANDTGLMSSPGNINGIIGIGNSYLTSWSLDASVGAIPTVSCAFEGQNINFTGWGSVGIPGGGALEIQNPSVLQGAEIATNVAIPSGAEMFNSVNEVSAVRPGDITVLLSSSPTDNSPVVGFDETDLKVQSANFAMTIGREPIRKLGSLFAIAREITFPINCTMSVTAVVGDSASQKLFTVFSSDSKYTCAIKLKGRTAGSATDHTAYIVLKNAKINSQNITSSIGPNKTVTMELGCQIGKNSGLHIYAAN